MVGPTDEATLEDVSRFVHSIERDLEAISVQP